MHFAVVLTFSALVGASFAGESMTSDLVIESSGTWPAGEASALESQIHDAYERMSNRKLWRELIKKRNQLETAQLQWQHLLNLRQERMNKLSRKPLNYKIPVKGIPAEITRQIEEILLYRPVFYKLYESENDLDDKSEESFNRHSRGSYRRWGSGDSRQQHEGSSQGAVGTSLYQRLTQKRQSSESSSEEGKSKVRSRKSHAKQPLQRATRVGQSGLEDKSEGLHNGHSDGSYQRRGYGDSRQQHEGSSQGAVGTSLYQRLTQKTQSSESSSEQGKSKVQSRKSHATQPLQRATRVGQSGVYPCGEESTNAQLSVSHQTKEPQGLTPEVQSEIYSPVEKNSNVQPRISHGKQPLQGVTPLGESQVNPPGEGSTNVQPRIRNETAQAQVQAGVHPPSEGSAKVQPKMSHETAQPQAQVGVFPRVYFVTDHNKYSSDTPLVIY